MIYIDCPKPPPVGPMAGHGLYTHIRRLKQDICTVPSPLTLVSIPSEEQVALVETESSPYPMPTEPLWNVPYSTPYCECIYSGPTSASEFGPPIYQGGNYGGSYPIYVLPSVGPIPEPSIYLFLLIGVLPLWNLLKKAPRNS